MYVIPRIDAACYQEWGGGGGGLRIYEYVHVLLQIKWLQEYDEHELINVWYSFKRHI